ncbi:MAG: peptidoglycan DD-metalloendopeptidase family protein [Cyanobacteria bacterium P01_F01_bin.53]
MSNKKANPNKETALSWKWQIAQRLAKSGQQRTRQNLVAGYVMDTQIPALETKQGIAATLALNALVDALKEQNDLNRRRQLALTQRYEHQRSLIEALVQFIVVFILLLGVGSYAAFDWAINTLGAPLALLDKVPGFDWLITEQDSDTARSGFIPGSVAFGKLDIATPYLYDDSPPGAWDFTLINPVSDSTDVPIPSPCPGVIDDIGTTKRAGNYLWLTCTDKTRWFMAHLDSHQVSIDSIVKLGQPLAIQGSTGNSTGDHIHAVIDPPQGERDDRAATKPILDKAFALWQNGNTPAQFMGSSMPKQTVTLIKSVEGLHLSAYPDGTAPNGQARWSIGYGTPSRPGEVITAQEAEKRLAAHLAVAAAQVETLVTVPLNDNQRAALISFQYNTGGLESSKLLTALNKGEMTQAALQFGEWIRWLPHDKTELEVSPGLVKRRQKERQMFLGQQIAHSS